MKAWIGAGSARIAKLNSTAKPVPVPDAARDDYEAGLRAWNDYLRETGGDASREMAELASTTYFQLVEIGSTDPSKATANAVGSVRAQKIVCGYEASLYTLNNLAVYEYFNGEYAAGDRAARRAAADAPRGGSLRAEDVLAKLDEYKERGKKFVARVKRGFETLEETGEDELDHAIKGYGAPAGLNGYEPGTAPAPGETVS